MTSEKSHGAIQLMEQKACNHGLCIFRKEERLWPCADGGTLGVSYFIHCPTKTADFVPGGSWLPQMQRVLQTGDVLWYIE
jgi:hypothetical protein